jgi:hypothetical protein
MRYRYWLANPSRPESWKDRAVTDDLVAWLRERLDEDEQTARATGDAHWSYDRETFTVRAEQSEVASRRRSTYPGDPAGATTPILDVYGTHIARWEPARVLAEVQAKRRLLTQFELRSNSVRATVRPATGGVWDDLLRLLALPYAEHPDYRPEWAAGEEGSRG